MELESEPELHAALPRFDVEALSGILGSISIACWVFVFSPQIIENFQRRSAEGLSTVFLGIWLLGDVFNIIGAILQGVLPTMIILAVYYTVADVVLLIQCYYYHGFTVRDVSEAPKLTDDRAILDGNEQEPVNGIADGQSQAVEDDLNEETPLLSRTDSNLRYTAPHAPSPADVDAPRRRSSASYRGYIDIADGTRLTSIAPRPVSETDEATSLAIVDSSSSPWRTALINIAALVVVCLAGFLGWWISTAASRSPYQRPDVGGIDPTPNKQRYRHGDPITELPFDAFGQIFGYLCAILYLGSRVPQLLLNYRRKSTEGVSLLFFLFAVVGNLTYVASILAYEPPCARWDTDIDVSTGAPFGYQDSCNAGEWHEQYRRYIMVNLSWIVGSGGTLLLDLAIFVQFWMYRGRFPHEGSIRVNTLPNTPVDATH